MYDVKFYAQAPTLEELRDRIDECIAVAGKDAAWFVDGDREINIINHSDEVIMVIKQE